MTQSLESPPVGSFWIAQQTLPFCCTTKTGEGKKQEWVMIEGVPCRVISVTAEKTELNSFTSAQKRTFKIDTAKFSELFTTAHIEDDCIHAPKYPTPIHISEFEEREKVSILEKKIKKITKNPECNETVKRIIEDKLFQMIQSQGAPYITIEKYETFKSGSITLSKHQRFGSEIFNRNCRWCPPIDICYDDYVKSPSYPAPLGIRPKDFCLPSELVTTMTEMITQIYNMVNVDKKSFAPFLEDCTLEEREPHKCKYCGEALDVAEYSSEYKSENNFMEICHRDPNERFIKTNMYWGHGECNRRQGGFSEDQRKRDGIRLMYISGDITEAVYQILIASIKSH